MDRDDDRWFVYTRTVGRFSARPVRLQGWIALVGVIAATTLVGLFLGTALAEVHPMLYFALLPVQIGLAVFILVRLILAKGRRVS